MIFFTNLDGFKSRWMCSLSWINNNPSVSCTAQLFNRSIDIVVFLLWITKAYELNMFINYSSQTSIHGSTIHQFHHNKIIVVFRFAIPIQLYNIRMFQLMHHWNLQYSNSTILHWKKCINYHYLTNNNIVLVGRYNLHSHGLCCFF